MKLATAEATIKSREEIIQAYKQEQLELRDEIKRLEAEVENQKPETIEDKLGLELYPSYAKRIWTRRYLLCVPHKSQRRNDFEFWVILSYPEGK